MSDLVKIRLSNCRPMKPFWAKLEDVNTAFLNVHLFINLYIDRENSMNVRGRHNIIRLHQIPFYKIEGYACKDVQETSKRYMKPFRTKHYKKYYRMKTRQQKYVTNVKFDEWAKKDIYPIPMPKIISTADKCKDPSGIHPLSLKEIELIFIDHCFGVYYTNTVNYSKHFDDWDIRFHYDVDISKNVGKAEYNIALRQFLRIIYSYYKSAIRKSKITKEIARLICNSRYGFYSTIIANGLHYSEDFVFGKYIISCETNNKLYEKEFTLSLDKKISLIDEIKTFISDMNLTPDTNIGVTFVNTGKCEDI